MIKDPRLAAKEIVTAGALFLGNASPTVTGDYVAGPSTPYQPAAPARRFRG